MDSVGFGQAMQNVRNHRDIKFIATEPIMNFLMLEPNHQTTKFFFRKLIRNRNERNKDTNG